MKKDNDKIINAGSLHKSEVYRIPQIKTSKVGLRSNQQGFKPTDFVSPMHGRNVKDILSIPDYKIDQDIILAYDPFREKSKISDEELIAKYGTKYPEFQGIESKTDRVYPKKEVKQERKEKIENDFGLNIGVLQKTKKQIKEKEMEAPIISFKPLEINKEVIFDNKDLRQKKEVSLPFNNSFRPKTIKPIFANEEQEFENEIYKEELTIPKTTIIKKEEKPVTPSYQNNNQELKYNPPHVNTQKAITPKVEIVEEKPIKKNSTYKLPPVSLLNKQNAQYEKNPAWLESNKQIINQTLMDFGIEGEVCNYTFGPTVTRYEVKLSSGVNVKKIVSLEATIKMNLSAKTIRIEAPIPGKPNVGIEVPNAEPRIVQFGEIVDRDEFLNAKHPLYFALGLDIDGVAKYANIAKMPHGLVAGATNSGKSVCINTLLISLLLRNHPDDLKLILIDPKQVELISYNDLPHLITPVISDAKLASQALKWAVEEMEGRYHKFSTNRVRDIESYNEKMADNKMPYILIVIDELADLIMVCSQDVEDAIQRLTQKARAAGIHLIVATQRPTTDVVKGTIKANIPTRIAFRVASFIDSNTILDGGGAETLLGRGDMLFKEVDQPIRIQGAYVSSAEIDRVTEYIINQGPPNYIFTHEVLSQALNNSFSNQSSNAQESNEVLYNAALLFIEKGICSINMLQQRFSFGFNRSQKIVETLEAMGIVSEKRGTLGREILVTESQLREMFDEI